jgi:hypothetical protein
MRTEMKKVWVEFDLHPVIFMWVAGALIFAIIRCGVAAIAEPRLLIEVAYGYLAGFNAALLFTQWLLTRARRRAEAHLDLVKRSFEDMIRNKPRTRPPPRPRPTIRSDIE